MWTTHNKLHRLNKPAWVEYYSHGGIKSEEWYHYGKLHRKNGPTEIEYYHSGNIYSKKWYHYGKLHRKNRPAVIEYGNDTEDGNELYNPNGDRNDGVEIYIDNNFTDVNDDENYTDVDVNTDVNVNINDLIHRESWYQNGELHRINGPAVTYYYDRKNNSNLKFQGWFYRNKLHRNVEDNLPAEINFHENGKKKSLKWYNNGVLYKKAKC
jgi:hypothetical protein